MPLPVALTDIFFSIEIKDSSCLEHLSGVAARSLCDVCAGEHSRDLFDAGAGAEFLDPDLCLIPDDLFLHEQVAIGEACDLRLMCDTENLIRLRKFFELDADRFRDATADACVNLIEDNRARKLRRVGDGFQDEHQS